MEKAVDHIRRRYGIDSVQRASFLKENSPTPHAVSRKKHLNQASQLTPERNSDNMDHIIRHSYTASTDGQSVEALLRSHGYSKSLINRIKLTEDGLMIAGQRFIPPSA